MKRLLIRSNHAMIAGIRGYMPRMSNGTLEECNSFQKSLRVILDTNGIKHYDHSYKDSFNQEVLLTVLEDAVQDKVETILFYNYACRFKIDLS